MFQNRAARRWIVTYAVLVAISLLLLAASDTPVVQELRQGIGFAVTPIQGALGDATRSFTSIFTALGEIDALRQENRTLQAQVEQLQTEEQQLQTLQAENDRLAHLLGMKGTLEFQTEVATVIGRQSSDLERVITLDRGTDTGVNVGDAVLSEGGALIGSVTDAGTNYSSVMLISDTRSVVIGLVDSSRATGEVDGRLSALLAMTNIPSTEQVAVDDTVVTAGIDLGTDTRSPYPKGLLIGRVVEVQSDASAVVQTALIQPAADLDDLERVLVITDFQPPGQSGPGSNPTPTPSGHH
jgi:rod shape-determining protein MreC